MIDWEARVRKRLWPVLCSTTVLVRCDPGNPQNTGLSVRGAKIEGQPPEYEAGVTSAQ
jgi:hypothetical protein